MPDIFSEQRLHGLHLSHKMSHSSFDHMLTGHPVYTYNRCPCTNYVHFLNSWVASLLILLKSSWTFSKFIEFIFLFNSSLVLIVDKFQPHGNCVYILRLKVSSLTLVARCSVISTDFNFMLIDCVGQCLEYLCIGLLYWSCLYVVRKPCWSCECYSPRYLVTWLTEFVVEAVW